MYNLGGSVADRLGGVVLDYKYVGRLDVLDCQRRRQLVRGCSVNLDRHAGAYAFGPALVEMSRKALTEKKGTSNETRPRII